MGTTNIKVSKLCFGSLTIGPLQANLPLQEGAEVIRHGIERGINFIDTAELYETYPYIDQALKGLNKEIIIATKSYSYTRGMMAESLEKARRQLNRDVIDIFLLHEQDNKYTIEGHRSAWEYLLGAKSAGIVKAIGISTHNIKGAEGFLQYPEMDIIHPIVNYRGLGIQDGSIEEMLQVLEKAKKMGKGIYGMKPLGGGNLLRNFAKAFQWALARPELDAIAVGMQTTAEVDINIDLAEGKNPRREDLAQVSEKNRKLLLEDYCEGCGQCINKCKHKALFLENDRAKVIKELCVLCGYCGAVCPNFAIKII